MNPRTSILTAGIGFALLAPAAHAATTPASRTSQAIVIGDAGGGSQQTGRIYGQKRLQRVTDVTAPANRFQVMRDAV